MVLFPPPFYFVFYISNLLSYIQNNFSYELARPIMGTIFLVYTYLFYTSYSYNSISRYAYLGISAHIPRRDLVIFSRDLVIFSSWHASSVVRVYFIVMLILKEYEV